MLKLLKLDFSHLIILTIISVILVFNLFIHKGIPATFDEPTHIANIAQVYGALRDGEFPARWGQGFARYGLPIPIIAQQTTSYLGAFLTFVTHDVLVSYNIVVFIGALVSVILMYVFLSLYTSKNSALLGSILFNFAPYRIMNVYIRGALPEFFASVFIISILIALYLVIEKRLISGYLLLVISVCLLLLTHPFMFVVGGFIYIPYGLFLLYKNKLNRINNILGLVLFFILGIALSFYYIFPLFAEIKYFYYGSSFSHFVEGHFLNWGSYLSERWYYFYQGDIFPRGHVHLGGVIETYLVIGILIANIYLIYKKRMKLLSVDNIFLFSVLIVVFFTLPISGELYRKILPLGNIQHPWRMLTAFIILPPIIIAIYYEKIHEKYKKTVFVALIIILGLLRFPQLYGKNYTNTPQDFFYNTPYNLHGLVMNTVWMGDERDYPFQKIKAKIIDGQGKIISSVIKNASRKYSIEANTPVRMVDYTFYYPGWKVFVDEAEVPIQFQDPEYRGVITYDVPVGDHQVKMVFEDTKVRKMGNLITLFAFFIMIGAIFYVLKKIK